jgi:hypothetical protein
MRGMKTALAMFAFLLSAPCQVAAVYFWYGAAGGAGALMIPFFAAIALSSIAAYHINGEMKPPARMIFAVVVGLIWAFFIEITAVSMAFTRFGE